MSAAPLPWTMTVTSTSVRLATPATTRPCAHGPCLHPFMVLLLPHPTHRSRRSATVHVPSGAPSNRHVCALTDGATPPLSGPVPTAFRRPRKLARMMLALPRHRQLHPTPTRFPTGVPYCVPSNRHLVTRARTAMGVPCDRSVVTPTPY
ncbi:hypothetical protein BC834DRAFT_902546 [Gloeopeniophorella convolvens]|nr:hypothetical protein BC834DRAFT_902546 [Gloeopeniophorella convolvens]